jgi:hypothetical protein
MQKRVLLFWLVFILMGIKSYSKTEVDTKVDLLLPYEAYNKLSNAYKIKYIKEIRRSYFAFEKQYWNIKKVSFLNLIEESAYAASKWVKDKCTIGGRILNVNSNGLCPTFGLSCGDKKDGFQCGRIFYSICIERQPLETISDRCNVESEKLEQADSAMAIAKEDYDQIRAKLEEATKVCGPEIPSPCEILKQRIEKVDKQFGKTIATNPNPNRSTSRVDDLPTIRTEKCIPVEIEVSRSAMGKAYSFTEKIDEDVKTWQDEDGILALLALRHKVLADTANSLTREEQQFVLSIYKSILKKEELSQDGCSSDVVSKALTAMRTVVAGYGLDNESVNVDDNFKPLSDLSQCMTFGRSSGQGNRRSTFHELFKSLKSFKSEQLRNVCTDISEKYKVRGPWVQTFSEGKRPRESGR